MTPHDSETRQEEDEEFRSLPPLTLSPAATEEIRRRLAGYADETGLAFFVITQPGRVGFHVGVGFEPVGSDRPLRGEYDVPVQITDEDWAHLRGYTIDVRGGRFAVLSNVAVRREKAEDPETAVFTANRLLVARGEVSFSPPPAPDSPFLIQFLLQVPGVRSIRLTRNRCAVTRQGDAEWEPLLAEVEKRLQAYLAHGGEPVKALEK